MMPPTAPQPGVAALAERRAVLLKELRALEITWRHDLLTPELRGTVAAAVLRARVELSDLDALIASRRN